MVYNSFAHLFCDGSNVVFFRVFHDKTKMFMDCVSAKMSYTSPYVGTLPFPAEAINKDIEIDCLL